MLFASLDFLLFLPLVLAGYWLLGSWPRLRLAFLILASYFFYAATAKPASGSPAPWWFSGLLFGATVLVYATALLIERSRSRYGTGRAFAAISILANLGVLFYFKYTGFLLDCAEQLGALLGWHEAVPELRVALPLGVSFYTFQCVSYTVDVYKGTLTAERSFLRFALYVAFFPHLVSGPIVRGAAFLPLLRERLRLSMDDVNEGLYRITKGLVKKVIFADFIAASFTDIVLGSPSSYSSAENLLALYAFTLQIYADFSGYCDMALGVARLFGLKLPENFDRPYLAASIGEFWRRWHMTLSSWLRDYVFFPLGGSRVGPARAYFNVWLTMFLVGMWHGASLNFVVYGNLQAFAMVFDRTLRKRPDGLGARVSRAFFLAMVFGALAFGATFLLELGEFSTTALGVVAAVTFLLGVLPRADEAAWSLPLHVALTFHFVVLSRVFFRADTLELARETCRKLGELDAAGVRPGLFRIHAWYDAAASSTLLPEALTALNTTLADYGVLLLIVLGLAAHFLPPSADRAAMRGLARLPAWGVAGIFAIVCATVPQLLDGPRPNIYFAF